MNDIPIHPDSKIALFADDTLLYASGKTNYSADNKLQKRIAKIRTGFPQWRITINPFNTNAIIFTNKSSTLHSPRPVVRGILISWSHSIKYLGVHIDKNLNCLKHMPSSLNKAKAAKHLLYLMLNRKRSLSTKTKAFIYTSYIRPIFTYASAARFINLSRSSRSRIDTIRSVTLRNVSNLPLSVNNIAIRQSLKIPTVQDFISFTSSSLKPIITSSPFLHISDIAKRKHIYSNMIRNRPIKF